MYYILRHFGRIWMTSGSWPQMILSGRKIRPYGVALTPSIVDGSRSANTARDTYLPPVHRINIFYLLLNEFTRTVGSLQRSPDPIAGLKEEGRGQWAEPLVRGSGAKSTWSWKPLSFWVRKEKSKFASFSAVCKFLKPQALCDISFKKRIVYDGMDIVVYDKKCIKSVNFSYSLTTVTKKTQSHRVRKKNLTGPTPLLPRPL